MKPHLQKPIEPNPVINDNRFLIGLILIMNDSRLTPRSGWDLRSSGLLRSE